VRERSIKRLQQWRGSKTDSFNMMHSSRNKTELNITRVLRKKRANTHNNNSDQSAAAPFGAFAAGSDKHKGKNTPRE